MSRDSWATPLPVYLALDAEFDFQADLCASDTNAKHPLYVTEADDALSMGSFKRLASVIPDGNFAWCNPPYSDIAPWVGLCADLQDIGIGTVLLVMADSSVGWYYEALQHCNEIREVVKGRLAFINPETGKPVGGNSKGSIFLIFDPYGRQSPPRRSYIERDQLMADGVALMTKPDLLFPGGVTASTEFTPLSPEPQTEFTPDDLHHLYVNGELAADHFPTFLAALVVAFGRQENYVWLQLQVALGMEVATKEGKKYAASGLSEHQLDFIAAVGRWLPQYNITDPAQQVAAIAQLIAEDALRATTISDVLTQFNNQEAACPTT